MESDSLKTMADVLRRQVARSGHKQEIEPKNTVKREIFPGGLCCKCGNAKGGKRYFAKRKSHPYCNPCHAAYMREWRKTHPMSEEARRKDNCRSYAGVYLRRGKIKKEPCKVCRSHKSQMHHPDYTKPLLIEWMCRPCHLLEHHLEKTNSAISR